MKQKSNETVTLLEDALPYLPEHLKHPVTLLLKANELEQLSKERPAKNTMSTQSIKPSSESIEMMLKAMRQRASASTTKQLDHMLQVFKLMKLYQTTMFARQYGDGNPNSHPDDFLQQLRQILNN